MRSNKQNRASRTNGTKSKGPVSATGKMNSAANANTHNLAAAGALILLSNEDKREFYNHQVGFIHRFQPIDAVEYDLVQRMISASWRQRRIEAMECALMEIEMDRQRQDVEEEFEAIDASGRQVLTLFGTTDASIASGLLLRYASAARRAYASSYRILKDLQGDRFNRPSSGSPVFLPAPVDMPPQNAATDPEPPSEAPAASLAASAPIRRRQVFATLTGQPWQCELDAQRQGQNAKLPNEPKAAAAGAQILSHAHAA